MSLEPIRTRYETKCVCDFCGYIQDEIGVPPEHRGEEIPSICPVCNIGEYITVNMPQGKPRNSWHVALSRAITMYEEAIHNDITAASLHDYIRGGARHG